jgi:hypothetical protein
MIRNYALLAAILWGAFAGGEAARRRDIHLASKETSVTLEAGAASPRLVALTPKGDSAWSGVAPDELIKKAEVRGEWKPLRWKFNAAASQIDGTTVSLVYDSQNPRLRLFWEWRVRAVQGPLEHIIRIKNLDGEDVWLPMQDSLRFDWHIAAGEKLHDLWIEKGAGGPSAEGTHWQPVNDGYKWSGESSTYAHPKPGQQREMVPYLLMERSDEPQSGWYVGIEFSGRTRIAVHRHSTSLQMTAGLNPEPGPFRTHLMPQETFETPAVFVGTFSGGPDGAGNILRRWVREVLNNPVAVHDPAYPLVVNNSWGSGMAINESQAYRMIRDSAELGFEMFHLDAGWFRAVGDWHPDPRKFPHGLAPVADYTHKLGMRFGLWADWAQASLVEEPGTLYINDPRVRDYLITDPPPNWVPGEEFKSVTIDLSVPAVHDWASTEVSRMVRDYRLDMLEHDGYVVAQGCERKDHPHAPPDPEHIVRYQDSGFLWVDSSNSTDVSYHATRSYYDIHERLRKAYPKLLLEICNDGGRMVDFGSAAHGDYFSISDAYDPTSNRRAFFDNSYVLPPAMLEGYVEKYPAPRIENLRYVLRSGMMGWFTLMLDTTQWSADEHAAAHEQIALYKTRIRPLIREADLFHASARPDGLHWDGIEYFDSAKQRGVLFAFRGSSPEEVTHMFPLQGLGVEKLYRLTYQDHSSADQVLSGEQLMQRGVQVSLPAPNSSELVFIDQDRRSPLR